MKEKAKVVYDPKTSTVSVVYGNSRATLGYSPITDSLTSFQKTTAYPEVIFSALKGEGIDLPPKTKTVLSFLNRVKKRGKFVVKEKYFPLPSFEEISFEVKNDGYFSPSRAKKDLKAYETPLEFLQGVSHLLKELIEVHLTDREKKKEQVNPLTVIDFQAGSGKIISALSSAGIKAKLLGAEIRNGENDEDNKVFYETDWRIFASVLSTSIRSNELEDSLFFLNPPYTGDGDVQRETFEKLPNGALVVGLFSTKVQKYLQNNLEGLIVEIPRETTGYQEKETPQRFLFVIGKKKPFVRKALFLQVDRPVSPLTFFEKLADSLKKDYQREGRLKNLVQLFKPIASLYAGHRVEKANSLYSRLKDRIEYQKKVYSVSPEKLKKLFSEFVEKNSFKRELLRGARIFPDLRFFSRYPLLTLSEVLVDRDYLRFLKEVYPSLFEEVEEVARELKLPVGEKLEEKEVYLLDENPGMIEVAFWPKKIPYTKEVEEVLINQSFLTLEEEKVVKALSDRIDFLVIKMQIDGVNVGTESSVGYTSTLVAVDKGGKELFSLKLPLKEFYSTLIKKGIISPKEYKVVEPDLKLKEKLVRALLDNQKDLLSFLSLSEREWKEIYQKYANYLSSFKNRARAIIRVIKENPSLVERFTKESVSKLPFDSLLREKVVQYLTSVSKKELLPYLERVIRIVSEEYKKGPKAFFERPDKEEFVKDLLSSYPSSVAEDLKTTILEAVAEHYFFVSTTRQAFLKTFLFLEKTERMKSLLEKGQVEEAYSLFKELFLKEFSLMPHQFNEAVNLLAKWEKTGEGGHLLGWEMRSGKSLTFLMTAYLSSLLLKKDSIVFPKTANVSDLYYQALTFLPSLLPYLAIYAEEETVPSSKRGKFLFSSLYPNLFRIVSLNRNSVLRKLISGSKAEELLKDYSSELEELIKISQEKLKSSSLEELITDGKFSPIKEVEGYEDEVKLALYYYLKRHEKDFNFENPQAREAFFNALKVHGKKIKALKEKKPSLRTSFSVSLVPKTAVLSYNFKIPISEVVLTNEKNLSVSSQYDYKTIGKTYDVLNGDLYFKVFEEGDENAFVFPSSLVEELEKKGLIREKEFLAELNGGRSLLYAVKVNLDLYDDFLSWFKEKTEGMNFSLDLGHFSVKKFKNAVLSSAPFKSAQNLASYLNSFFLLSKDEKLENSFNLTVSCKFSGFPSYEEVEGTFVPSIREVGIRRIDPDFPERDLIEKVWARGEVRITVNSLREKPNFSIVLKESDRVFQKPFICSNANAYDYFVHSESFNDLACVIVDEADETTSPSSNNYRALFYLGKKASVKVAATGTPTSGYPETVYSLLGLVSDLSYEEVVYGMSFIKDKFSSYVVKPSVLSGIPYVLFYVWNNYLGDFKTFFLEVEGLLKDANHPKEVAVSFINKLDSFALTKKDVFLEKLSREMRKYPAYKMGADLLKVFKSLRKVAKTYGVEVDEKNFIELAFSSLRSSLKREAGTLNPFGFVSSLFVKGTSLSFRTRSSLKGKEEKLTFDEEVSEVINRELSEKGKVEAFGTSPFAPDSELLRNYYDLELSKELGEKGYSLILDVVVKNFELYLKELKKSQNLKLFLEHYGAPFSPKEFKFLLEKETTSRNDDAVSVLKTFFINNYDLEKTAKELSLSEEKVKAFLLVWKDFASFLRDYYSYLLDYEEFLKKNGKKEKKEKFLVSTASGITFTPVLSEFVLGDGKEVSFSVSSKDGIPLLTDGEGNPLLFSTLKTFNRVNWNGLGVAEIPYRLKKLTPEEGEVIDSFSNLGHYERIQTLVKKGKSFLISSSRVLPLTFSVLDALSFLKEERERRNLNGEVHFLVRVSDKRMKEVLDKIDKEGLERLGIFLKFYKNNNLLDAESKKLKKRMEKGDEVQLIVASTDETIARGVDLSHLEEIVYVSPSKSGKTASQLFARLFNAKDKNEGKVFIYGIPLAFSPKSTEEEPKLYPNGIFYKSYDLLKKFDFIKKVMTGEIVNFASFGLKLTEWGRQALDLVKEESVRKKIEREYEDVLTFGT